MSTFTSARGVLAQLIAGFALLALLTGMVPTQAFAIDAIPAPQTPDEEFEGNYSCTDLKPVYYEIKLETEDGQVANGTFQGITLTNVTVKDANPAEPMTFDWSKATGEKISAVIVKAGNVSYVYDYSPAVDADINLGTQTNQAISHISFCYEDTTSLTLNKAVSGGDADADDWTLTILGAQGNSGAGSVTKVFEDFAGIGNKTWELTEAPTNPESSITDNYVAGSWSCEGNSLPLSSNQITLVEGENVTCEITNTYEAPVLGCIDRGALNYNPDANTDDGSCTYMCAYSDTTTTVDGNPSVLTYVHPTAWTKEFALTPAKWIWDAEQVTAPSPHTRIFTKTFFSPEATTGELKIAVDNFYNATLNGNPVTCLGTNGNNHAAADVCAVNIQSGINTLVVTATNDAGSGGYTGNPAGVIFTIVSKGNSCVPVNELGSITIEKEVVGFEGEWAFDFEGDFGNFELTNAAPSMTEGNLVASTYDVAEVVPEGWDLTEISCVSEGVEDFSYDAAKDGSLSITLAAGADVTCTFENEKQVPPICPMGPNLLKNGSFEAPAIAGSWQGVSPLDWVVTKVADATATVGEIWANGFDGGASDGNQHLELDATEPTVITQTVATVPGATYELRFDYRSRPNTSGPTNGVEALADGVTVKTVLGTQAGWSTFSNTFVATDAATDIAFKDRGSADSLGTLLDNAVLCQVSEAPSFTIGGTKYNDRDNSGTLTEGDTTIEGWMFELLYDGVGVDTTTTDENGAYEFVIPFEFGKNPALYSVREVMPEGEDWVQTGLFVEGEPAEVCRLPLLQEGDELQSARIAVIDAPQSITMDCDFFNYSDEEEPEVPRCELTASDNNIRRGQEITLSWDIVGNFFEAVLTQDQDDDYDYTIDEEEATGSRDVDGIRRDTTFTLTMFDYEGESEELVEIASCDVFVDVRSSGGGGTRVTRDRDGEVAGDSTSRPAGEVLGDQVSVVPLGAADAGAGGAAPVGIPGLGLAAVAFVARRK